MPKLRSQEMTETELLKIYRDMVLIREFEERPRRCTVEEKSPDFVTLYIGEEAVAVGALNALHPDDYVISSYRDHGHCLIKGTSPKEVMAELFGRSPREHAKEKAGQCVFLILRQIFLGDMLLLPEGYQ